MRTIVFMLVCCLGLAGMASADSPAPSARVAVISSPETADLAALLSTELSQENTLALVERDEFAKIGDEIKLRQLASTNPASLGQMLGADGLLFLEKTPDAMKARFTAVGLGYILFDQRFNPKTDPPRLAKEIAHRVADYASKLKLRPAEAVPVSVLNLRSDTVSGTASDLERNLTLLLESRLSAQPEYVVLERRHAGSLAFENVLAPPSSSLLQGTLVVDGTLTPPLDGKDEVAVRLRVRSKGGEPSAIELRGSTQDLPAMAEGLADGVRKATGSSAAAVPWQPQREAREYLMEGLWGYQHNAVRTSLEALDAAALLGETAPDLTAARIAVLCGFATGSPRVYHGDVDVKDDPRPEPRIDAALRATDEFRRYEEGGMESGLLFLKPGQFLGGRTVEFRWMVTRTVGSLTRMLDRTHHSRADELRAAFRSFTHYPPALDQPADGMRSSDLALALDYADTWAESLDEEKTFYRAFYAAPIEMQGVFAASRSVRPDTFGRRFFPDMEKECAAFLAFMKEWCADPATCLPGLRALAEYTFPPERDTHCRAYYDALWEARENLAATRQLLFYLNAAFDNENDRKRPEADPKLVALLHFVMQRASPGDAIISRAWRPELCPVSEAPALWKDLQEFQAKAAGNPLFLSYLPQMRQSYIDHFGDPEADKEALKVTQFWLPPLEPGTYEFSTYPLQAVSDGVWVAGSAEDDPSVPFLYHVRLDATHPDSFFTEPPLHPPILPHEMASSPTTLYLLGYAEARGEKPSVAQLDMASGHWETHEIPSAHHIVNLGGQIYLSLSGKGLAFESGIALYDGHTGATTVLASSRRRPAQNQFDDREAYNVSTLFMGPGNKPCASIGFGETYVINAQPGTWPRLIESGALALSRTDGVRTLLFGHRYGEGKGDVVFMIDPAKPEPELWLGKTDVLLGTRMVGKEKTPVPPWPKPPVWPTSADAEKPLQDFGRAGIGDFGFRGDDLFNLVTDAQTRHKTLRWYRRGSHEPISIPLVFENGQAATAIKASVAKAHPNVQKFKEAAASELRMSLCPQGILFTVNSLGFWFLPFSDVDAYLQAHPPQAAN